MKPLLLDLFCGAGGCAMGYSRAGFDVLGVDHKSQPHYPFDFIKADALKFLKCALERCPQDNGGMSIEDFSAVHASPPCQHYSAANNIHQRKDHPDLLGPVRKLLIKTGLPYVIENVPRSPLQMAVQVCGLALGLNVKRHRWFESNALLFGTECGDHSKDFVIVFGGGAHGRAKQIARTLKNGPVLRRPTIRHAVAKIAMGIDWMTRDELSQAIPPAYTEFLGKQLIAVIAPDEDPK